MPHRRAAPEENPSSALTSYPFPDDFKMKTPELSPFTPQHDHAERTSCVGHFHLTAPRRHKRSCFPNVELLKTCQGEEDPPVAIFHKYHKVALAREVEKAFSIANVALCLTKLNKTMYHALSDSIYLM